MEQRKTVYITERRHEFRACDVPFVKVYSNADAVELYIMMFRTAGYPGANFPMMRAPFSCGKI